MAPVIMTQSEMKTGPGVESGFDSRPAYCRQSGRRVLQQPLKLAPQLPDLHALHPLEQGDVLVVRVVGLRLIQPVGRLLQQLFRLRRAAAAVFRQRQVQGHQLHGQRARRSVQRLQQLGGLVGAARATINPTAHVVAAFLRQRNEPFPVRQGVGPRRTADGRQVGRLDAVFQFDLPIAEAQLIQERSGRLQVRLVPASGYTEQHGQEIVRRLRQRVGDLEILLDPVERIPRSAAGKLRDGE